MATAQQSAQDFSRRGSIALNPALAEGETKNRLREGSVLADQLGTFKLAGDRIVFVLDEDAGSLRVLENLALERIWKMLDETSGRQWIVNGTVTEYRGNNFLFIERAVVRSRQTSPPATP